VPQQTRHPIQLVEVRVDEAHASRRRRTANQTDLRPTAYLPRAKLLDRTDDPRSFSLSLVARVRVPLGDDELWFARCKLTALFAASDDVAQTDAEAFARLSGIFLVWPFARSALTNLSQMAGVTAPQLPLLTRPGPLAVEPPRRP
jgi:preprotein translocase subunit SecB